MPILEEPETIAHFTAGLGAHELRLKVHYIDPERPAYTFCGIPIKSFVEGWVRRDTLATCKNCVPKRAKQVEEALRQQARPGGTAGQYFRAEDIEGVTIHFR